MFFNIKNKNQKAGWQIVILLFLPSLFFTNCKNGPPPPKDLSKLEWLIGTWEVNNGSYYEKWLKMDDQRFLGRSYKIYEGKDTSVMETIELILREKEILYIPSVRTSKGFKATEFKMTSDSDKYFIFENPKHDFPKKISYSIIDASTAKARIEDEKRKLDYDFKRIK